MVPQEGFEPPTPSLRRMCSPADPLAAALRVLLRLGNAVGCGPSARGARVATSIHRQIAEELRVREQQVEAAVALLDGGATVPFIARYRKEATGTLDDAQLRTLEERLHYLRELEERRAVILTPRRRPTTSRTSTSKLALASDAV